jgi:hypothetical protein
MLVRYDEQVIDASHFMRQEGACTRTLPTVRRDRVDSDCGEEALFCDGTDLHVCSLFKRWRLMVCLRVVNSPPTTELRLAGLFVAIFKLPRIR